MNTNKSIKLTLCNGAKLTLANDLANLGVGGGLRMPYFMTEEPEQAVMKSIYVPTDAVMTGVSNFGSPSYRYISNFMDYDSHVPTTKAVKDYINNNSSIELLWTGQSGENDLSSSVTVTIPTGRYKMLLIYAFSEWNGFACYYDPNMPALSQSCFAGMTSTDAVRGGKVSCVKNGASWTFRVTYYYVSLSSTYKSSDTGSIRKILGIK